MLKTQLSFLFSQISKTKLMMLQMPSGRTNSCMKGRSPDFSKLFFFLLFFNFLSLSLLAQQPTASDSSRFAASDDSSRLSLRNRPVQLIYNTLPAHLNTASTDAVYSGDILKSPVTSFRNAIIGRLAGLYTQQTSGQPGNDEVSTFQLRGQNPLLIIDGVTRRDLTVFDLEEIESITALKDAVATSVLGVRGARGALLITTKKGSAAKQQISFTAQTATQTPMNMPRALGAYDYARLYNEALVNDGLPPVYSATDLQGYQSGGNQYKYPNVDWRERVLNKSSRFNRYTLSASGGNQFARYFVSMEHVNQSGLFITSDTNSYNTNNSFKSYVIRSNVDLNINPKLTAGIYVLGRILNGNEPGAGTDNIFNNLLNTPNNAYPVYNVNNTYGGTTQFQNNILAQTIGSGYVQNYRRNMIVDVYLQRTLDEITQGLFIKALATYGASLSENVFRTKSFAVFAAGTTAGAYTQYGTNGDQGNSNGISYQSRTDYVELKLGYNRTFNNRHGINAYLLANRDNFIDNSDLPYTVSGGAGRFSYNFKEKYLADVSFGLNGSNRYAPEGSTKYGFFPAVGLGWNISKEGFMSKYSWINNLKLFGSYGQTGWDNPGYFTYIQQYFDGPTTYFGTGAGGNTSMSEQPFANVNLTWEKANKLNLGLQGSFLKDKLSFNIEYYKMNFSDLLMQRGRNSALIGNDFPNENIGKNNYKGWEFRLGWQESKKDFSYFIDANAALQNSEVVFSDEVFRQYDWMRRTGKMVGQRFGFISEGLFQSQAEINGAATTVGYTPQPGDIKYKDLNGDKVIDQFDEAPIGGQKPLLVYGANFGISYKGFDVSVLFQGVQNREIYLSGPSYWAFQNNGFGQAYEHNLGRWTPATAATATYPRLNVGVNTNNQATSSYWLRSGNYMRLKNFEVGYTLPKSITSRIKLKSARVFVNGVNLITFTSLNDMDPEVFNGAYPIQKVINAGINIKL
jgi:TonB-linked SusC/RagA family outer membrane protein